MREGDGEQSRVMRFRLYVAGESPNSQQALVNLETIRRRHFPPGTLFEIEIVDVMREPDRAAADHVLVTPTLVTLTEPVQQVVGNLNDIDSVLLAISGDGLPASGAAPPPASSPNERIRFLVEHLSQVHADLEAMIADRADAIIHPDLGIPILLREAQAALKRSEERYRTLAHHDNLTGLPNRLLFTIRLEHAIALARRNGSGLALLYLDVDRFKEINDTLGHQAGDAVLQEFGRRLQNCVRGIDTVARVGGDEFAVVVEGMAEPDDARRLAVKLIGAVSRPMTHGQRGVETSTSVGIALLPRDADSGERLLQEADEAMYRAKAKGRGSYEFYDPALNIDFGVVPNLEMELTVALRDGELELHYQPEVEVATGRIVAMEALLRWRHPRRGLLLPHAFMASAENTALMGEIGDWVLRTACGQADRWRRAGHPVRLDINFSARDLGRRDLAQYIRGVFAELGIKKGDLTLEIEIPERLLTAALRNAAELKGLSDLGVAFSVDQYGRDYSSIAALRALPITRLKIDNTIVHEITPGADAPTMLKALISMGHGLGLRIGASGVETDVQLEALRPESCDEAQGFLFSRPLPADAATALLEREGPLH